MVGTAAALLSCACMHHPPAAASPALELGAGWRLSIDGQYRPRLTLDSGRDFFDGDAIERLVVTHRARLGVVAAHTAGVSVTLRLQDVRAWGEETDTLNDFSADGLDLYEAYGEVRPMDSLFVRFGRQGIAFDDERLVGTVDWTQRARSFDGVRVGWKNERGAADAFFTWLAEDDADADAHVPAARTDEAYFAGLHGQMKLFAALDGAVAWYYRHTGEAEEDRHTVGFRFDGKAAGAVYDVAFYYQLGGLGDEDIGSWLAAARGGYEIPVAWKPTVLAWGEVLSGDGTPAGTFDTLFATNHKFYGEADFFIAIPAQTGFLGLIDVGGRLAVTPHATLSALVDFHHFRAADEPDRVFGHEIDVKLTWKPWAPLSIQPLYAVFLPDEPATFAGSDPVVEHTFYLTTDLRF